MAHAAIDVEMRASWVLSVSRTAGFDNQAADLSEILPVFTDVAAVAVILLPPTVRTDRATARARREVESILAQRSFQPLFRPIMNLEVNRIIGHEALTRFEIGIAPDPVFDRAAPAGLAVDLELARLRAAVTAARYRDSGDTWLSLNVSPELLTSSTEILARLAADKDPSRRPARVLRRPGCPLLLGSVPYGQ